ncbi:NAD(P)-dependent oxidoreductase [Sorangium sp. So ce131]|uniref:NAD(P)-dependent oxidoreductase n=1 Tax=Sorangium sp. So ce131 TaxID=3133282 RepID=UPI003F5EB5E0
MDVGFIGIGNMGAGMAGRLIEAGHRVTVHNRTREKAQRLLDQGAAWAGSPREAAAQGEVVITMLADDKALRAVVHGEQGMLSGMRKGAIHLSMSTISVALADELEHLHTEAQCPLVGAPVFGRPPAAAQGKLFVFAGGEAAAVARCEPLFQAMGQRTFHVGGHARLAHLTKILGNFMLLSTIETLGEAFAVARKAGLPPQTFLDAMTGSVFAAPLYRNYGTMMVEERYSPEDGFRMPLALKDAGLALQAAEGVSAPLPVASLVRDHLLSAIGRGHADLDLCALALVAAENAGAVKPR